MMRIIINYNHQAPDMMDFPTTDNVVDQAFHELNLGLKLCLWGVRHEVHAWAHARPVCSVVLQTFEAAEIGEAPALLRLSVQQLSEWALRPVEFNHPNIHRLHPDEICWLTCLERVARQTQPGLRDLLEGTTAPDGDDAVRRSLERIVAYVAPRIPLTHAVPACLAQVQANVSYRVH
ncbi:MAG: hypothetical protein AAGA23_08625 [Pseudomonadota bacterium]